MRLTLHSFKHKNRKVSNNSDIQEPWCKCFGCMDSGGTSIISMSNHTFVSIKYVTGVQYSQKAKGQKEGYYPNKVENTTSNLPHKERNKLDSYQPTLLHTPGLHIEISRIYISHRHIGGGGGCWCHSFNIKFGIVPLRVLCLAPPRDRPPALITFGQKHGVLTRGENKVIRPHEIINFAVMRR